MSNEEKKFRSPIFFKDNPEDLRVNPLYIIDDRAYYPTETYYEG